MRKFHALPLIIVFFISGYVLKLLYDAGSFKEIQSIPLKNCLTIPSIIGPEDMAAIPGTPLVLISSEAREEEKRTKAGDLYLYNTEKKQLVNLDKINFPKDFYPHGIDVIQKGQLSLIYVINQYDMTNTRIDVFQFNPSLNQIMFLKSIENQSLTAANDLAMIAEDQFYYTRDFHTKIPWKVTLLQYLRIPTGSVWLYDKGEFISLVSPLMYANGIAYHKKTNTLYLSEMMKKTIHSYAIQKNKLVHKASIKVSDAIDNITFYNNEIIAAGHPKLLALKNMRAERSDKSPSVVMRVNEELTSYDILYENNGQEIAATSVALRLSDSEILMGSVFDDHLLHCSL